MILGSAGAARFEVFVPLAELVAHEIGWEISSLFRCGVEQSGSSSGS